MILNNDRSVIKETVEVAPVTEKMLLKLGFKYYQSSYDKGQSGWVYRDKDEGDNLLTVRESKLSEYSFRLTGVIYFPQYTDTPRLMTPHPERQKIEVIIYNEGQLKLFIELVEQAAELRMDIKKRSDELKRIIQEKLWKG